jgi:hypothetical protein
MYLGPGWQIRHPSSFSHPILTQLRQRPLGDDLKILNDVIDRKSRILAAYAGLLPTGRSVRKV